MARRRERRPRGGQTDRPLPDDGGHRTGDAACSLSAGQPPLRAPRRPDQYGAAGGFVLGGPLQPAGLSHGPRAALSRPRLSSPVVGCPARLGLALGARRGGDRPWRLYLHELPADCAGARRRDRPENSRRARAAGKPVIVGALRAHRDGSDGPARDRHATRPGGAQSSRRRFRARRRAHLGDSRPGRQPHLECDRSLQLLGRCRAPIQRPPPAVVRSAGRARLPCRDHRRLQATAPESLRSPADLAGGLHDGRGAVGSHSTHAACQRVGSGGIPACGGRPRRRPPEDVAAACCAGRDRGLGAQPRLDGHFLLCRLPDVAQSLSRIHGLPGRRRAIHRCQ